MLEVNSNREEFQRQYDPQFFIEKLTCFEKRVQSLLDELRKTLTYIAPSDFYDRIDEANHAQQIDQDWVEIYKDIVAWKIQGRVNVPLMRLAQEMCRQFGGQIMFWLDTICDFAQNEKYDDNLRIWQVFDAYKTYLHLPIGEYEKNRKFRRLAKNDIQITRKLISLINELNETKQNEEIRQKTFQEILSKLQECYKSHESSNKKLVEFLKSEDQKNKNLQFFESGNPIYAVGKRASEFEASNSKSRKIFKEQNAYKQKMITDFSVQMEEDKNRQLLKKIVGKDERPLDQQKADDLQKYFYSMQDKSSFETIENLRMQFIQSRSKLLHKKQTLYTNVISQFTIIEYYDFPIPTENCPFNKFNNPFEQSEQINYDCTQYELYEEFEAEGIDLDESDSEENSDDDSLDEIEKMEFYIEENDGYDMDEEDKYVQAVAFRVGRAFGGNQWIFNHKQEEPFWINQRHLKSQKKPANQDSSQSQSQASYLPLNQDTKHIMIESFYQQTMMLIPNNIPMQIDKIDEKPSKQIELTKEEIQQLKGIFNGRTRQQAMDIINSDQSLSEQFTRAKIKKFTQKLSKKNIRTQDGKKSVVYFVPENKENQLQVQNQSKINQKEPDDQNDDDSQGNSDELETRPNDSEYQPSKLVKMPIDSKSRSSSQRISNNKSFNVKDDKQSKSQSSSISNNQGNITVSNQNSQNSKKSKQSQSKQSNCESLASLNMTRLRPRNSRPNYNLDQILGTYKEKKQEKDIEI